MPYRADLQTIIEHIPGRVTVWNTDATCRYANRLAERQFGLPPGAAVGMHVRDLLGETRYEAASAFIGRVLEGKEQSFEQADILPDGKVRYSKAQYVPLLHDGEVKAVLALATDITEIRESRRRIEELAHELAIARERERHAVAQELHEGIGQELFALQLTLGSLAKTAETPTAAESLNGLAECVRKCVESLRSLANGLRPQEISHLGVAAAVSAYGRKVSADTGIAVSVVQIPPVVKPTEEGALFLFRAAQETITDILRNTDASQIQIYLSDYDRTVVMTVGDNGTATGDEHEYQGFRYVSQQVGMLGGSCTRSKASETRGSIVRVEIPA